MNGPATTSRAHWAEGRDNRSAQGFCGSAEPFRRAGFLSCCIVAAILLVACASGGGQSSAESGQAKTAGGVGVVIMVENTESPGRGISVELTSADGDRRLLGSVGPRRTETFEVTDLKPGMSYRLVAGLTGGGNVSSESFTITPGARVTWTLPLNSLRTSS
jgi:hypothetical protein